VSASALSWLHGASEEQEKISFSTADPVRMGFMKSSIPKQSRASTSGTPGRVPEGVAGGAWGPIFRAAGGAWGVERGAGGIRAAKKVCGGLWVAAVGPGKQAGAKLGSRSAIDFRLEKAY